VQFKHRTPDHDIGTCEEDLIFQDWTPPKYLQQAHMHTRAQSPDAIFQQHTQEPIREVTQGRIKIQTFFSRALYNSKNAIHHLEKKVGIPRATQNRSPCYLKMYQDVHSVDWQVKLKHNTLDHQSKDE